MVNLSMPFIYPYYGLYWQKIAVTSIAAYLQLMHVKMI